MTNPTEDKIDAIFADMRAVETPQSADIMARILADAATVQDGFEPAPLMQMPGRWARMMDALGGWPAVSGLAAATVAGIWVGAAPPTAIEELTASVIGDAVNVSLFSADFGFDTGVLIDG